MVGAGIAGLTAAALAAKAGKKVLLLEAHHQSG
ncbi:FAD-dependent oxidoreductase, partial [Synechococcus sp.]